MAVKKLLRKVKRAARFAKGELVGKKSPYYTNTGGELRETTTHIVGGKKMKGSKDVNLKRGGKTPSRGRATITAVDKGTKYGITPSGVRTRGSTPAERRRKKQPTRVVRKTKGKGHRKRTT